MIKTNLVDLLMRDNKCWSRITDHGGNGYRERLPFKQGLCHTESMQTIQSGDGMPINCTRYLIPTMCDPGIKSKTECEKTTNLKSTENSINRPPNDSQDKVAITEIMQQADTAADENANQKHGNLSDGITTRSGRVVKSAKLQFWQFQF